MAYFWVNQGETAHRDLSVGALWVPYRAARYDRTATVITSQVLTKFGSR